MKRLSLFLAAALITAPGAVFAQDGFIDTQEEYVAELVPSEEVPAPTVPDDYAGDGNAVLTVSNDEQESSMDYEVEFKGLTGPAVMAHIHLGQPGEAGPPIFWLTPQGHEDNSSPLTGTLTEDDLIPADGGPQTFAEALDAIRAGDTYVNVHTEQNVAGEIRGQLEPPELPGSGAPEIPDSATAEEQPPAPFRSELLIMLLVAAGAFVLATQRFSLPRT